MLYIKNLKALLLAIALGISNVQGQIAIRPATMDDLESISKLTWHAYNTHFKSIYIAGYADMPWGQDPDFFVSQKATRACERFKEFVEKQSTNHDYGALLACEIQTGHTDQLRGMCFFFKQDPVTVHIKFLFIDETCRGQGVGKELLFSALRSFDGVQACILYTLTHANEAAHSFYKHLGFTQTGPEPDSKYPDAHIGYRLDIKNSSIPFSKNTLLRSCAQGQLSSLLDPKGLASVEPFECTISWTSAPACN